MQEQTLDLYRPLRRTEDEGQWRHHRPLTLSRSFSVSILISYQIFETLFSTLRFLVLEVWSSTFTTSVLFSASMEWSSCSTLPRRWLVLLRDEASRSRLWSKDAIRSSRTSHIPDKPCASSVWDPLLESVQASGGDRTTGVGKGGAVSRDGKLAWARDLSTKPTLDCKRRRKQCALRFFTALPSTTSTSLSATTEAATSTTTLSC